MPEREIAARGGAVKWRTVRLKNGKYVRVAVVKKAGPRGGHTVAGDVKKRKGTR
jgi:hypothetical protein